MPYRKTPGEIVNPSCELSTSSDSATKVTHNILREGQAQSLEITRELEHGTISFTINMHEPSCYHPNE